MAKMNGKPEQLKTHQGAVAKHITPEQALRRSVLSCMLWEKEYYEGGVDIAKRIGDLVPQVAPEIVANLAIEARKKGNLRHVPLWLATMMLKHPEHKRLVADVLAQIINRPDELGEMIAMYRAKNKKALPNQLKKGIALAVPKFNEYQLAKYNRDTDVKLRDVLFMCHPKPNNSEQAWLWKKLIGGYCVHCGENHYDKEKMVRMDKTADCPHFEEAKLTIPDTWEVELSQSKDKRASWTRLLQQNKLGALALLRNLRNMNEAGVDRNLIKASLEKMDNSRVLPFRFISAARYAPHLEPSLEVAMFKNLETHEKLKGQTVLLVDVSGSMNWKISGKSDLTRIDAACGLAMLLREICEDARIFTFSEKLVEVPPRRGFALRDAIVRSQPHSGTYLGASVKAVYSNASGNGERFKGLGLQPTRLVAFTDEQSSDKVFSPPNQAYMINVASAKNGIGYGGMWAHIDGFSEAVVDWLVEFEKEFK